MNSPPPYELDDRLEEAVLAYLKAGDEGRPIDRDELLSRYPDVADALATFFADQGCVVTGLAPLREPTLPKLTATVAPLGHLGKYYLLEELGRVGMGVVFKARQTDVDRLVALKMIRVGAWASPAEIRRFRN